MHMMQQERHFPTVHFLRKGRAGGFPSSLGLRSKGKEKRYNIETILYMNVESFSLLCSGTRYTPSTATYRYLIERQNTSEEEWASPSTCRSRQKVPYADDWHFLHGDRDSSGLFRSYSSQVEREVVPILMCIDVGPTHYGTCAGDRKEEGWVF